MQSKLTLVHKGTIFFLGAHGVGFSFLHKVWNKKEEVEHFFM